MSRGGRAAMAMVAEDNADSMCESVEAFGECALGLAVSLEASMRSMLAVSMPLSDGVWCSMRSAIADLVSPIFHAGMMSFDQHRIMA